MNVVTVPVWLPIA